MNLSQSDNSKYWDNFPHTIGSDQFRNLYPIGDERGKSTVELKLSKARNLFAGYPDTEKPLLLYDYPNGRGFLLTDHAIYGSPNYIFFKPIFSRINISDIREISFLDRKLTINGQHVADLCAKDGSSLLDRIVTEDYLRRMLNQEGALSDDQLRALDAPGQGEGFVAEMARAGASKLVLYKIILSSSPDEAILFKHGNIVLTDLRIVILPDQHQLRKDDERLAVYATYDKPQLVHRTPHVDNIALKVGIQIAKKIHNDHVKATHIPKVIEYLGFISPGAPDPLFPEYSSLGLVGFCWKQTDKALIRSLIAEFEKFGIRDGTSEEIAATLK